MVGETMVPKRLLLRIHRWTGLLAAALILTQAATGTLLVFRTGLAELVDPAGMIRHSQGAAAPLGRVIDAARTRYPGFGIERVAFPQTPRGVYLVHLLNAEGVGRYVSVDPGSAQVLRAGAVWAFPGEAALQIHYRLMTGRVGLAIVMLVAISLLTMAATGLSYWWPKPGRWRRSLAVDLRLPGRVVLRHIHRSVGVFAAASALFSASTGLLIASEFFLEPGSLTAGASGPAVAGDVDAALAVARAAYPGRGIRDVRMPGPGKFNVFFWAPEKSPHAVDAVRVDLATGRVVGLAPAERDRSLWVVLLPIHSGDTFGRVGSTIILLGGLGLMFLATTGPLMWWQARRRQ